MENPSSDVRVDATEASFEEDVLRESTRRPVVVDFWAPWCGPCRVLGPALERLADEGGGRFRLVKVDVDQNPGLAALFRVQGIPAVKAFVDGQVIDEFTGALPEHQLRIWLERFVPGPADDAAAEGEAHEAAGRLREARAAYETAISLKGRHPRALLGLARLELAEGRNDEAERHLDLIGPGQLEREVAALRLRLGASGGGLPEAKKKAEANPDDLDAQVAYGRALAAAGESKDALERFLGVVRRSPRAGAGEEARKAMLEVFDAIGARSELADEYRAKLAAELYK